MKAVKFESLKMTQNGWDKDGDIGINPEYVTNIMPCKTSSSVTILEVVGNAGYNTKKVYVKGSFNKVIEKLEG